MLITIPATRLTRKVDLYVGTRWADGVYTPHLIAYFYTAPSDLELSVPLAAIVAITVPAKLESPRRPGRKSFVWKLDRFGPTSPDFTMSKKRELWAEAGRV